MLGDFCGASGCLCGGEKISKIRAKKYRILHRDVAVAGLGVIFGEFAASEIDFRRSLRFAGDGFFGAVFGDFGGDFVEEISKNLANFGGFDYCFVRLWQF